MDSKPKTATGVPQSEMARIRLDDGKPSRSSPWLVVGVVALAVAVIALGAALIVETNSEETPTASAGPPATGLADAAGVALVDNFLTDHNTRDADTVEGRFAPDGVFTSVAPDGMVDVYEGRNEIRGFYADLFAAVPDLRVERVSPILQTGGVLAFTVRDSNQTEMLWVLVRRDGTIAAQWNVFHAD